ncbi:MAG: ATP-dependent DNA helicase RecG, partial [Acidimicrobiales bacterium]
FGSIHLPGEHSAHVLARRRLVFDELLRLQVLLVSKKRALALGARGIAHDPSGRRLLEGFLASLPFELTAAQSRAIGEIEVDLYSKVPMNRLLQGDVGSGKTVVALASLLVGIGGGHQGALMVPTEVLAEQHYLSARRLLAGIEVGDPGRLSGLRPLGIALLTSRTPGSERQRILAGLREGRIDLVCGTHALLTDDVEFASLGVVVVDEQHRFGVEQRARLSEKAGHDPDLLVMTATPIPRSAAMTVYGDLDHTVLDELPKGRTPVRTRWLSFGREPAVWKAVRSALDAGRQAYVVCALVRGAEAEEDELDKDDGDDDTCDAAGRLIEAAASQRRQARSATEEHGRLQAGELEGYRVGLLHGQLGSKEKERVMAAFRQGELQVLVATTVVEVGVDVANATVMVIEDADRFGIAQLHQLRGRVGRGRDASLCVLLAEPPTPEAERRVTALVGSTNGFELAEIDLELRGGGTVLGARQKGRSDLKLVRLSTDRELVEAARKVAIEVVGADPTMASPEHGLLRDEVDLFVSDEERQYLFRG